MGFSKEQRKKISERMKGKKHRDDALSCHYLWDINNGITLCQKCHRKIHNKKEQF